MVQMIFLSLVASGFVGSVLASSTSMPLSLAVDPGCGSISTSSGSGSFNAGLKPLEQYKRIVAFGEEYTFGGRSDGGPLPEPIITPPNPTAGGRLSNGPVWAEYLANDIGAELNNYAALGAFVDSAVPPSDSSHTTFFSDQVERVISRLESEQYNSDTTLYLVFFGMKEYDLFNARNASMLDIASWFEWEILTANSYPTYARHILVVDNTGLGFPSTIGQEYKSAVYQAISGTHVRDTRTKTAFVDLAPLWSGVLGAKPGYEAFGYTNKGTCLVDGRLDSACADPSTTFYWTDGMPTTATHRLIADFIEKALTNCIV
ncbi:hypothetical protein BJ165DRAFT_559425 [Panaeolus papilionaceus]|nr:hypothetical protein BJ165DRAFT_559425 [Panaeolus papilionaceus]